MPVTLTDDQVAELRQKLAQGDRDALVRQSAEAIWNDPEMSDSAKALWKKKFPETTIADYDLKREVFGRLDAEKKERDDAAREKAEAEQVERYRSQKARVQKERGFTDDAMERMEKEMNDRKVYDYEVMADSYAARNPKPIENTQRSHMWNHSRSDEFKKISEDPEGYAFDEMVAAMNRDEQNRRNR